MRAAWRSGMVVEFYGFGVWLTGLAVGTRCGWAEAMSMVDGETVIMIRRDLIGRISSLLL